MLVPDRRQASLARERVPEFQHKTDSEPPQIASLEDFAFRILRQSSAWKGWARAPITLENLILSKMIAIKRNRPLIPAITREAATLLEHMHAWMRADIGPQQLAKLRSEETSPDINAAGKQGTAFTASLYSAYLQYLAEQRLISPAQAVGIAADELTSHPELAPFKTVVLDGFDTVFSGMKRLMMQLAQFPGCSVTFTLCAGSRGHLAPLFGYSGTTEAVLRSTFAVSQADLDTVINPPPTAQLFSAPNEHRMAEAALVWLQQMQAERGFLPHQCAVITSGSSTDAAVLRAAGERLGLTLAFPGSTVPLAASLSVRRLLYALAVVTECWKVEHVLGWLNAHGYPNSMLPVESVRIAITAANGEDVAHNAAAWLQTVEEIQRKRGVDTALITQKLRELEALQARLLAPALKPSALAELLVECLNAPNSAATELSDRAPAAVRPRRLAAVLIRQHAFLAMRDSESGWFTRTQHRLDLLRELAEVLRSAVCPEGAANEAVQVLAPSRLHQSTFKAAALFGFDDRVWPAPIREDPYLRDRGILLSGSLTGSGLHSRSVRLQREVQKAGYALTAASEAAAIFYSRQRSGRSAGPSVLLQHVRVADNAEAMLPHSVLPGTDPQQPGDSSMTTATLPVTKTEFAIEELQDQAECPLRRLLKFETDLDNSSLWERDASRYMALRQAFAVGTGDALPGASRRASALAAMHHRACALPEVIIGPFTKPLVSNHPFKLRLDPAGQITAVGTLDRVFQSATGAAMLVSFNVRPHSSFGSIVRAENLALPLEMQAIEETLKLNSAAAAEQNLQTGSTVYLGRARFIETTELHNAASADSAEQGVHHLTRDQYTEMQNRALERARDLARSITEGECAPRVGLRCFSCEFTAICRAGRLWLRSQRS
jgi:hypothetical protein